MQQDKLAPANAEGLGLSEKMRKLAISLKIARIGFGLTLAIWAIVQAYAYVRFHEVPFVAWEFVLLALGLLVFVTQKKAALQKQITDEAAAKK